jgi:hypothetical protein
MSASRRASVRPIAKARTVKISVCQPARVTISGNWSVKISASRNAWRMRVQSARLTAHASRASVAA